MLSQVASLVGLDTEALLDTMKREEGLDRSEVLAQLRNADTAKELVTITKGANCDADVVDV